MCNREIKFKLFLDKALSLCADYVATGHYARIKKLRITNYELKANPQSAIRNPKIYQLRKGIDPAKDQSYFLYTLKQEQLAKSLDCPIMPKKIPKGFVSSAKLMSENF